MAERSLEHVHIEQVIPLAQLAEQDAEEAKILFDHAKLPVPVRQHSFDERDPWMSERDALEAPYERGNVRGWATTSDGGAMSRYHGRNEDLFTAYEAPHASLLTVIDGGGGSSSGRAAAVLSSLLLHRAMDQAVLQDPDGHLTPSDIDNMVSLINRALLQQAQEYPGYEGHSVQLFGTIAGAYFLHNEEGKAEKVIAFARGDARVLVLREGKILPEASSWFQNQAGMSAMMSGDFSLYWDTYRHQHSRLLSGLGMKQDVWNSAVPSAKNTARILDVRPGDRVILYTDGVGDMITDLEIERWAKIAHTWGAERGSSWLHQKICSIVDERVSVGFDEEVKIVASEDRESLIVPNPQYRHEDGTPKNLPSADNYTLATYVVTK